MYSKDGIKLSMYLLEMGSSIYIEIWKLTWKFGVSKIRENNLWIWVDFNIMGFEYC